MIKKYFKTETQNTAIKIRRIRQKDFNIFNIFQNVYLNGEKIWNFSYLPES